MCLFRSRPDWEEDVVFANRHARHPRQSRTSRVTETVIRERVSPSPRRSAQYIQAPRASTPIIRSVTPLAAMMHAPTPPPAPVPAPVRLELVSVEEDRKSPRASRASVGGKRRHGREEVYIEREKIRERVQREEPDTFRYVGGSGRVVDGENRRRSRSITYETNPRLSGRLVERERVVVEDGGRRREYYRKP